MVVASLLLAMALNVSGAAQPSTVLDEHFDRLRVGPGQSWGWKSSAYSKCTDNTSNPNAWKLDRLTPDALSTDQGYLTITAKHREDGAWDTGLLTTGDSCGSGGDGTRINTGDFVLIHVRLPEAAGAWPGLWTWRDGGNELDVFEWHADHPNTLEFFNHVKTGFDGVYFTDPMVDLGRWVYIGARFGADDTSWYVGETADGLRKVGEDHVGVGADFSAYPIINLSVDNGPYHAAPPGTGPMTLGVDEFVIEHLAADDPGPG